MHIPLQAYQEHRDTPLPQVDVILGTYEEIVMRLERLRAGHYRDEAEKKKLLAECQLALAGMALGCGTTGELGNYFCRLYEFMVHCLTDFPEPKITDALQIVRILQESFENIRGQALELERQGILPGCNRSHSFQTLV